MNDTIHNTAFRTCNKSFTETFHFVPRPAKLLKAEAEWGNPGQYNDLTARPAVDNISTRNRTDARILWLPVFNLCWQRLLASQHFKAQKISKLSGHTEAHFYLCWIWRPHGDDYDYYLQGCDTVQSSKIWLTFRRNVLLPSIRTKSSTSNQQTEQVLVYSSTLKILAVRSSETSISFKWTTWRRNPKRGISWSAECVCTSGTRLVILNVIIEMHKSVNDLRSSQRWLWTVLSSCSPLQFNWRFGNYVASIFRAQE